MILVVTVRPLIVASRTDVNLARITDITVKIVAFDVSRVKQRLVGPFLVNHYSSMQWSIRKSTSLMVEFESRTLWGTTREFA